jgi:hypothetical protein
MNVIPSCAKRSENVAFSLKNPYLRYRDVSLGIRVECRLYLPRMYSLEGWSLQYRVRIREMQMHT